MSKHTPGPWEVQNMTVFNRGCMFVANCDGLGDVDRMEMSRANARLIAAAPDLLAALQELLNMPDFDGSVITSAARKQAKHRARDAIAKAGG